MKAAQLKTIHRYHDQYLSRHGIPSKQPDKNKHLATAIITGEIVKLRPLSEIISAIASHSNEGYSAHRLELSEILTCPSLKRAIAEHEAIVATHNKRRAAYLAEAAPILAAAELDAKSDATATLAAIHAAARKAGL